MPDGNFRTLAGEVRREIDPIKGSRFLACAAAAENAEDAESYVRRIRAEMPGATHHCWAYRLGPLGEVFRSSDDGEPGGSAGRPILQQLTGKGVSNAVVVVARWFGGTKLGVGGLVRAYSMAAAAVLERASLRTVHATRRVLIEFSYESTRAVEGLLAAYDLEAAASEYGESVRLELDVPVSALEAFERDLRDRSLGRARFRLQR